MRLNINFIQVISMIEQEEVRKLERGMGRLGRSIDMSKIDNSIIYYGV